MLKSKWYSALLVVSVAFAASSARAQMSSPNYSIPSAVINSGGGTMSSANYTLVASIGEPIIGPSSSTNYGLNAGFLATLLSSVGRIGDVNKDGAVDINDVRMLLSITSGGKRASDGDVDYANGNVVADTQINMQDAAKVIRSLNNLGPL